MCYLFIMDETGDSVSNQPRWIVDISGNGLCDTLRIIEKVLLGRMFICRPSCMRSSSRFCCLLSGSLFASYQNPEHVLLFAAGNDGDLKVASDREGVCTMNSPSIAKSVMTVGVSSSGITRLTNTGGDGGIYDGASGVADIDIVAYFSSHGLTGDYRVKPEVVAPGDQVRYPLTVEKCRLVISNRRTEDSVQFSALLCVSSLPPANMHLDQNRLKSTDINHRSLFFFVGARLSFGGTCGLPLVHLRWTSPLPRFFHQHSCFFVFLLSSPFQVGSLRIERRHEWLRCKLYGSLGTSMATPIVAGTAVIVRESVLLAVPSWLPLRSFFCRVPPFACALFVGPQADLSRTIRKANLEIARSPVRFKVVFGLNVLWREAH